MRKDKSKSKHADDHLSRLSKLIEKPGTPLEGIFEKLVNQIPLAWQYPEITCARIIFGNKEFKADNFKDTKWKQSADVMVYGEKAGCVEVCCLEEKPESYEGPFLKKERDLLETVAGLLGRIIERKKAGDKLREGKAKFRDFLDHISDGIYRLNKDGYFTFVNKVIVDRSGIPPEKFYTLHFLDIVMPEYHEIVKRNFERVIGGEETNPYELSYKRADGRILNVEVYTKPIYEGGIVIGLQGVSRDITERKKIEELLRESEQRFRCIFDLSPQAIALTELETGKIIDVNNKYCELTGYEKEEIIGRTSIEIGHFSEDDRDTFTKELKSKGYVYGFEKDFRSRDGSVINSLMFSKIIQAGRDNFIITIFIDITLRKQAEEKLLQYRKHLEEMVKERTAELEKANMELTEAKERFQTLSGSLLKIMEDQRRHIARELHDEIGQQLTVLKINLQNAQQLSNSKECPKPLNDTMAVVESLVQVVRNLSLELRPSVLDDLGLAPALRMYVKRLEKEAGVAINFVADSLYHRLPPDIENACFRVAQEALTNVIKHSKAQKVGIELRQVENKLQLTIFDDGIGFDVQSALEQAKMGRSFGLLGIHERIFLAGGKIKIESTPKKGTKIQAYFPLHEES